MECDGVHKKTSNILRLFGVDICYVSSESDHSSTVTAEPNVHNIPKKCSKRKCSKRKCSSFPNSSMNKLKKERRRKPTKEESDRIDFDCLELPREIIQKIESLQDEQSQDKKPRLFMQKILSTTDVEPDQSRLLIPRGQIKDNDFANEQEQKTLHEVGQEGKVQVTVLYFDEDGQERKTILAKANLARWPIPKKKPAVEEIAANSNTKWNYALQTVWKAILKASKLEAGNKVQVWWFRHGKDEESLGLVVLKVNV